MSRTVSSVSIALLLAGLLSVSAPHDSAAPSSGQDLVACSGINSTDMNIPDKPPAVPTPPSWAVDSSITIADCTGNAMAGSTVEVHIAHPFIGDLVIDLIAPDGSVYSLQWRAGGDSINIDQIYTVNLASEVANGTWKLRVQDMAMGDTGIVDSWTLNLVGGGVAGDLSIAASPASGSAAAGSSVTTAVSTELINGGPQSINLSTSGLPAGATAAFAPSWVTVGNSSTLTINLTGTTARGVYLVTITGTGASIIRTTTYRLTVTLSPPNCAGTNSTDVNVSDATAVHSLITIAGCVGKAGAGSTVEVHIVHTYIDDLIVDLVAPDGSVYSLHRRSGGESENIDQTYTANLTSEVANGTWKLRVHDSESGDTGFINTWTLNLAGGGARPVPCTGVNNIDVTIPDLATVDSSLAIGGCLGNAAAGSTVKVHLTHTYISDLVIDLIAPDGSIYRLHNRSDSLAGTFTVNLAGEAANGTWKVQVRDAESGDTGFLNAWTLTLGG